MHVGREPEADDFRKSCRSVKVDPFTSFMYWHMEWHTEHHTFPGGPLLPAEEVLRSDPGALGGAAAPAPGVEGDERPQRPAVGAHCRPGRVAEGRRGAAARHARLGTPWPGARRGVLLSVRIRRSSPSPGFGPPPRRCWWRGRCGRSGRWWRPPAHVHAGGEIGGQVGAPQVAGAPGQHPRLKRAGDAAPANPAPGGEAGGVVPAAVAADRHAAVGRLQRHRPGVGVLGARQRAFARARTGCARRRSALRRPPSPTPCSAVIRSTR